MSAVARSAVYLDGLGGPSFGILHEAPDARPTGGAVLLLPPWGWSDVASYRARRTWADRLAAGGRPTLRLDLPGTGDSAGSAADPDRLAAWIDAVTGAIGWLAARPGVERTTVVGLGLGGLVALRAIDAGAVIDDLVLWSAPGRGRQFVRQQRAFAGMQGARYSLDGTPEPQVLPDGWLEVNGFVLSADTLAAIESTDASALRLAAVSRALILDADGIPADPALAAGLRGSGVDVTDGSGPGWSAMTEHPQRHEPPSTVFETVDAWLAAAPSSTRRAAAGVDVAAPDRRPIVTIDRPVVLDTPSGPVRETPVWLPSGAGRLFGILAEPADRPAADVAAVFLNAGAVRRIGPNRIWVETARRWATDGVPTIRLDLDGIGDSDGDADRYQDVAAFYVRDAAAAEIRSATDLLLGRSFGPRIILGGLCAGGFWSFQGADRDERVTAALLLNPGALVWHDDLVRARDAARLRRLLRPAWWSRLLRGKVRRARIRSIASAAVRTPGRRDPGIHESSAILSRLAARDVTLEIAFSGDEPLEQELTRGGLFADGSRWPGLTRHRLPGRDHTLRPVVAQRGASAILDAGMRRELARGRQGDARPDDAATASDTNEQPTMTTHTGWTIPQPGPVVDDPTRIPAGVSGP